MLQSRLSHVCDACKARKVKCHKPPDPPADPSAACANCRKKGYDCVYSPLKRRFKARNYSPRRFLPSGCLPLEETDRVEAPTPLLTASSSGRQTEDGRSNSDASQFQGLIADALSGPLYMDQLLQTRQPTGRTQNASFLLGANENHLASSSMSFFSDSRLNALSACLGNDALKSLIARISHMVKSRVEVLHRNLGPSSIWNQSGEVPRLSPDRTRHLIDMFFENIHPLHPFLDRPEFESRAFAPTLQADLANGVSWTALYYTVLALGCEFDGGGSFAPGDGEAWSLFKVALDLYPRVLLLNTDLLEVQAITAMAVFCLNLSGTQIQGKIISEAARVAQRAFLNKASTSSDAIIRSRAFWVVYYIEKTVTFHHGTTSFIVDCDIGSPIPIVQEAVFGDFDWFLTSVRFARLYSRTFTDLFSISATNNSKTAYLAKINQLERLLEQQCQTIPPRFQPGTKLRPQTFSHPCEIAAALRVHYHYHELKIALHRLKLHVTRDQSSSQSPSDMIDMMKSARAVIDLTRVIYQEPSTPFFVMIFMPLTALFILFDLVIHYPAHPDARSNIVLLESVTGYFSALEYATSGYLPGSMLIQFASIARAFHSSSHPAHVEDINNGNSMGTTLGHPSPETLGTGSSTNSQIPWEVTPQPMSDESSQRSSYFPLDISMFADSRLTPGLEIMDLFGGPLPGVDFFSASN
ncbi:hypothetical protein BDV41DRAFT_573301 [Aspergillus transmontanensis]|uniref:Zn(2)-C6 fungal-type domain-containing protein n=1 Tax=Aspergillus transmontanensis TaxID=1034304 RepID=A0A5N6W8L0_9EURO|nr:hypothetical protein BDV41DRAFT_573301 [Aspergillus transmontanensis]